MAMSMRDFRVLEKLMGQTTSDNDAEALVALRKANELLVKYNYTWADAFARLVKVLPDPSVPDVEEGGDTIPNDRANDFAKANVDQARVEEAFSRLASAQLSRGTELFVASLKDQWDQRGFLTDKQRASLFRNADDHA